MQALRRALESIENQSDVGAEGLALQLRTGPSVALFDDRTQPGGGTSVSRRKQHAPEPGMRGNPLKLAPLLGQATAPDCTQSLEQREILGDAFVVGRVEPLESLRISTPCDQVEQHPGEIDAVDLRFPVRAQLVTRIPEPDGDSRTQATRTSRPLLGGVAGNSLGLEAVDADRPVVAENAMKPAVDDGLDAFHRERRLGDVRRQDHLSPCRRRDGCLLAIDIQTSVQLVDLHVRPDIAQPF